MTLQRIYEWSVIWQLPISLNKCSVLSFCRKPSNFRFSYSINGTVPEYCNSIRDLGITLCSDLSFRKHIDLMCNRARLRANIILRCFACKERVILFRAFITYVRPLLEYCCNVWSPYRICDIRKIESVQRRFTKRLWGLKSLSYADRLAALQADTLEIRRVKSDLGLYSKAVHGLLSVDPEFVLSNSITRGNGKTITTRRWHGNMERYLFHARCVNIWNLLPKEAVQAESYASFFTQLSKLDLSKVIKKSFSLSC